jgi:glucosamine--fructose-6-phosphate aminotransferase (isomerizing)
VVVIEDGEMVEITRDGVTIETLEGTPVHRAPWRVDWEIAQAEKAGYEHFMLKEIFEEPTAVADTLAGQLTEAGTVEFEFVDLPDGLAASLDRIWVTGCGTAYHAGLAGKEVFQSLLRVPVELAYAHEMRYSDPVIDERSLTIAISQSGETVDTLVAGRLAASRGARLLALTNVVGSTLSREADDVVYTRAGPEIAVASTKAYVSQLIGLYLLALRLGDERGSIAPAKAREMADRLGELPSLVADVLKHEDDIADIAGALADHDDIYFIGRGLDYAIATEGSLKLKEISYQHSEAMPAGELKHGTLALVTEGTPVVAVVTQGHVRDKTLSAVQEVKARGAQVIAVAWEDDRDVAKLADHVLGLPRTSDLFSPVLGIVPLQLLAYHVARKRGHDIDQPRNLAKSVTVE